MTEVLHAPAGIRQRPPAANLAEVLTNATNVLRSDGHADEIGALAVSMMMHRRAQLGGRHLTPNDYRRVEQIKKIVLDAMPQEAAAQPHVQPDRSTRLLAAVGDALAAPADTSSGAEA